MNISDHDLINAFGGTGKLAKTCGITSQAVSQWKRNGIPQPIKALLLIILQMRGESFLSHQEAA